MHSRRFIAYLPLLLAGALIKTVNAVGLWQESPLYSADTHSSDTLTTHYRYRILDTGGTGGMGGKGDVHNGLRSVDFWDNTHGWAAGEGGVFKTDDGGMTWRRILPAGKAPAYWWRVRMRGPDEIWALKRYHGLPRAGLFRSRDGGSTWTEILKGRLRSAADLYVRGQDIFVLCGDYANYRSSDGGRTWRGEKFDGLLHGTIAISRPGGAGPGQGNRIFVLGHFHRKIRLIRSDDSGQTWHIVPLPSEASAHYLNAVMFFASDLLGGIGLNSGTLLFTADGGRNWSATSGSPNGKGVTAIWMDRGGNGFFATQNNNPASPGLALTQADFRNGIYIPAQTAAVEFHEIVALSSRLLAVGTVKGMIPNDAVIMIDPE